MIIEELYMKIGGNYSEIFDRLESLEMVEEFLSKFLKDNSFKILKDTIRSGNRKEAFIAAHTLKGVCLNLSLGALLLPVNELTEALRPETLEISPKAYELLDDVKREYSKTVEAIKLYIKESGH